MTVTSPVANVTRNRGSFGQRKEFLSALQI
jgi:hypothetical protein